MIVKVGVTYQFSIPEHVRHNCDHTCMFFRSTGDDERPWDCIAALDEAIGIHGLVPGPNCHPGTYRAERTS
jgi:hypothetical protein